MEPVADVRGYGCADPGQQHDPGQLSVTAHHQPSGPAPRTFHQATLKPQAIGALLVNSIAGPLTVSPELAQVADS